MIRVQDIQAVIDEMVDQRDHLLLTLERILLDYQTTPHMKLHLIGQDVRLALRDAGHNVRDDKLWP